MFKRVIALLLAVLLLPVLSACSLEKLNTVTLPPLPGTEEAELATDAAAEEQCQIPENTVNTDVGKVLPEEAAEADKSGEEIIVAEETEARIEAAEKSEQTVEAAAESGTIIRAETEQQPLQSAQTEEILQQEKTAVQASGSADIPAVPVADTAHAPATVPVITVINETKPYDINRYQSIDIRGVIQTDCGVITQVYAVIMDSAGDVIQDCAYYPETAYFYLAGTVNACLRFGDLESGSYIYQLNASAKNGETISATTLTETAFNVISASKPATEALQSEKDTDETTGTDEPQEKSEEYSAKLTEDTSNAGQIWNYLVLQLNNPYAAAGILGNIQAESSCLPYVVENDTSKGRSFSISYTESAENGSISRDVFAYSPPGDSLGYGYGLCQWTMERKGNLYDYAKNSGSPLNSIDTQCGFLMQELYASFPALLEYLKTCTDAREACRKFCTDYEKAAVWGGRTEYAAEFLEKYAKN